MAINAIAQRLREAKRVVVFTGAGVSAESGISTFRDALTGLWKRFDPTQLATAEAYGADPSLSWDGTSGAGARFSRRSRMTRTLLLQRSLSMFKS
ncbi:NAD-dependent deacetylase [Pseudomonas sp. URMO17WK12:I10]|nr:NAD-dependent deacetylase [Pseudomonas sp. LAMO17WK12:I3]RED00874.1 NAD-dependent deacetylase [Pseudomonas sp. URMO17WK12:I10]SOD11018.1 NAD-dependent protein deacetylases, SIR2 family [Pseudomonas sp. URMO17WK12:I9]